LGPRKVAGSVVLTLLQATANVNSAGWEIRSIYTVVWDSRRWLGPRTEIITPPPQPDIGSLLKRSRPNGPRSRFCGFPFDPHVVLPVTLKEPSRPLFGLRLDSTSLTGHMALS
jgi:hypothetical protein